MLYVISTTFYMDIYLLSRSNLYFHKWWKISPSPRNHQEDSFMGESPHVWRVPEKIRGARLLLTCIVRDPRSRDDSLNVCRAQEKMRGAVRILKSIVRHIKKRPNPCVAGFDFSRLINAAKESLEMMEAIPRQGLEVQKAAVKLHYYMYEAKKYITEGSEEDEPSKWTEESSQDLTCCIEDARILISEVSQTIVRERHKGGIYALGFYTKVW